MLDCLNSLLGRHPDRIRAKVEIYTWQTCPYCLSAKFLLWWKGVDSIEYKIDGNPEARERMAQRAEGRRTVPQIFINDQPLGGWDDLYRLDQEHRLDSLLMQPQM